MIFLTNTLTVIVLKLFGYWLSFWFHFHALEKEMETHSSILAWRIPGTVEPGGLPSVGLHRVGHHWSDLAVVGVSFWGFPWWLSGKESACGCRRHRFDPWSGKIPHAEKQPSLCTNTESALKSPGATSTEPTSSNYWNRSALEPVLRTRRSHRNEKLTHSKQRVASARHN